MKVLILAKSSDDPATRYRVNPIVEALRARGDEVTVLNEPGFASQLGLLMSVAGYDLVFVQRKLFNSFLTRWLGVRSRSMIFDHDDAIFLKSNGSHSATRARRYQAMAEAADLVIGGNTYLTSHAARFARRSEMVPTSVDTSRYQPLDNKEEGVTLVWIGSRSTSRYLEFARPALDAIGRRIPGARLKIISDFQLQLKDLEVVNVPWSEASETTELASAHIGIAPMIDDPWTRGKCALKVIQYMAAGLPVISSRAGANCDVVEDGITGFLVDDDEGWVAAVERLVESESRRSNMGQLGRKAAEARYSKEACVDRVLELIDQVAGVEY